MNLSLRRIEQLFFIGLVGTAIAVLLYIPACGDPTPDAFGATPRYQVGALVIRDFATTNLGTSYGAGSEIYTNLSNRANIALYNPAAAAIVGTTSTSTNCAGAADQFFIPPGASATYLNIQLNTKVCLRYLGGATLTTGVLLGTAW